MKVLAAGDIHGDIGLAQRLAKKASDQGVDLVILCGDITYFNRSIDNLIAPFKEKDLKVLIIPGNHEGTDTTEFISELYKIRHLHGYSVRYGDVGIFGAGGSSVVGPSMVFSDHEMFSLLQKGFDGIKYLQKKVMVTHEHPAGSQIERFTQFFPGSKAISRAIKEFSPDILLCSHVHEAEGIEEIIGSTRVINVGKSGKILEL